MKAREVIAGQLKASHLIPPDESELFYADVVLSALGIARLQIVPIEPSERMLAAYQHHFVSADRFDPKIVWTAMLQAAKEEG